MRTTLALNPDVYRAAKMKVTTKRGRLMAGGDVDDRDALYSAMEGR